MSDSGLKGFLISIAVLSGGAIILVLWNTIKPFLAGVLSKSVITVISILITAGVIWYYIAIISALVALGYIISTICKQAIRTSRAE